MKINNTLQFFLERIIVDCSIRCEKCEEETSQQNTDDYLFGERLIREGWTYIDGEVICSKCANNPQDLSPTVKGDGFKKNFL